MKYVVEFFDGHDIRGMLVEKNFMHDIMDRITHCDPEEGMIVLDVTPEEVWRDRFVAHPPHFVNTRVLPVDRLMV
ncbi:hypothetical protein [Magnetococcus sp. PR-3]|uniref:hypothetical protein n=1 Tax=Magnetococcus sp. PR-3 TaxID=3120355 RepID=UPI002FCE65C8